MNETTLKILISSEDKEMELYRATKKNLQPNLDC